MKMLFSEKIKTIKNRVHSFEKLGASTAVTSCVPIMNTVTAFFNIINDKTPGENNKIAYDYYPK